MPDYKRMYFQLAAKVADTIDILVEAQRQGENDYTEEETSTIQFTDIEIEKEGRNKP